MKSLILLTLGAIFINTCNAQLPNELLYSAPAGLVQEGPNDHKIGRYKFLISFENRFVAHMQKWAAAADTTAGGYVELRNIVFDQIRLFTIGNNKVLLKHIDSEVQKRHCNLVNIGPYEIKDSWRLNADQKIFSYTSYKLTPVIGTPSIETDKIHTTEETASSKIEGHFCIKGGHIYFSQILDNKISEDAFEVLAIGDEKVRIND